MFMFRALAVSFVMLALSSANDFLAANPNHFYVFAVDRSDLANYAAQQFHYPLPAAVPTMSLALLLALMLLLSASVGAVIRRRKP